MGHNAIHWFRKDLRLHDNPSLKRAIEGSATFRGVFFLEASAVQLSRSSGNRWRFLLDSLKDLDASLQKLGGRLYVIKGQPSNVLLQLIKKWEITKLSFEYESEPFGLRLDNVIKRKAKTADVEVIVESSHTLYDLERIEEKKGDEVVFTFNKFKELVEIMGEPDSCVETIDAEFFKDCQTPVGKNHDELYGIPTLDDLGIEPAEGDPKMWLGGETEALKRLDLFGSELIKCKFQKRRSHDSPFPASSKLSPYLRFGCLSVRLMYHRLSALYEKVMKQKPQMSVHTPLVWRDFFFFLGHKNPSFDKMENNSMCLKIPWEQNASANELLQSWREGKTGYPWIDAIMRQMRKEGWVHHFGREAAGCFLTRGCLWVNWEEGFKVYEEMQIDYEWSIDAGCWMQLSCSSYFHERPHWLCPVEVGKALDPEGAYVRKYVPEVKNLPNEYVYEPWKAPEEVQISSGCVVGKDYPVRIKEHTSAKMECLQNMTNLYQELVTTVSQAAGPGQNAIHWFRKDLRLHDNPALLEALSECRVFYGLYIFDPASAREAPVSANKWQFLLESLQDLDSSLKQCRSRLYVLRGQPTDVLPQLFKEWKISKLTFESETEPFGVQRDAAIVSLAEDFGVKVVQKVSHTLYDVEKIVKANGGSAPTQFKAFETVIRKLGPPPKPVPSVTRNSFQSCITPVSGNHDDMYGLPSLQELGCKGGEVLTGDMWHGGEKEALKRLDILEEKILEGNSKKISKEACVLTASKTQLSPYLRFGCVSPRLYHKKLTLAYVKVKSQPPPLSLYRQLVWREFFFTLGSKNPNLDKVEANPMCVKIPWDEDKEALSRWKTGQTGFPWIDAIMRQLHQEGWIHHIGRQAVGCFLTRGCLWISWEEGLKAFDELMLDAEWSMNAGNWLWLSCSAFFCEEQVPIYCPVKVAQKLDPTGNFVRKYVPEVKCLPDKYIFEPWTAPPDIQKACNCIIGKDYPKPLYNYPDRRKICLQRLKEVYSNMREKKPGSKTIVKA